MDAKQLIALVRTLTSAGTSRRALAAALAGSLGLRGLALPRDVEAKKCPPCKRRNKKGQCKKNKPNGRPCPDGTCQNGKCRCAPTTCAAQGVTCGSVADGCGGSLACGTCTAPRTCGGGICCLPNGATTCVTDADCCGALICDDGRQPDPAACSTCLTSDGTGCTGVTTDPDPGARPCCALLECNPDGNCEF